jgi:pSer/pThr/pTyr-binding forkhead associated (FHA) protein
MTLFVVEERNGQPHVERSFDSPVVVVGRDDSECQIVFVSKQWPMVSRKHAEFRMEGGRCLLIDSGSRYGTFLDGRPISAPTEVGAGARARSLDQVGRSYASHELTRRKPARRTKRLNPNLT